MTLTGTRNRIRSLVYMTAAALLLPGVATITPAHGGSAWLPDIGGGSNISLNSLRERKFETIVRQQFDFSCGSAALATLLTYHYEEPTTEQAAFESMYELGDQEKIRKLGFSLLDIKGYLEKLGYEADGYRASLEALANAGVPAIALINVQGYKHFVVVKGLSETEVLVGDPALGLRFMTQQKFVDMWENQILFIIRNRSETGQSNFNIDREWQLMARAPLGEAVNRQTLESLTISLPRLDDFPL